MFCFACILPTPFPPFLTPCPLAHLPPLRPSYSSVPLKDLRDAFAKFNNQRVAFSSIPNSEDVGIIRVDSSALKAALVPSPSECIARLGDLLPIIAQTKNDELLQEVSVSLAALRREPSNVDEFVQLMSALNDTQERFEPLMERREFVSDMYLLLAEQGVHVSEEARAAHVMLAGNASRLKAALQDVEDTADANTTRFTKELAKAIPRLRGSIVTTRNLAEDLIVHSPDSDFEEVIPMLKRVQERVVDMDGTAQRFQRYQEILRLQVSTFEALDDLKADVSLKLRMWIALRDWNLRTSTWSVTPFDQVDPDSLAAEVQSFLKVALQAERGLPGSPVAAQLKELVTKFRNTLPVVSDLRCPALKRRHWDAIHDITGYQIKDVDGFTLGELVSRRIMDHADVVAKIASEAVQEAVLEEMLAKVETTWAELEFTVLPHKGTRDFFILGSVEEVRVLFCYVLFCSGSVFLCVCPCSFSVWLFSRVYRSSVFTLCFVFVTCVRAHRLWPPWTTRWSLSAPSLAAGSSAPSGKVSTPCTTGCC